MMHDECHSYKQTNPAINDFLEFVLEAGLIIRKLALKPK